MSLVFLDCETTGLDPDRHEIWELAYAIDDGPIRHGIVSHSLRNAAPDALLMNDYERRANAGPCGMGHEMDCRAILEGATIVGANPAFDAAFLRARWGIAPWHHRLLDIEAYTAGRFGWAYPRSLMGTRDAMVDRGHDIPQPDHTAGGDVATVQAIYYALTGGPK